MIAEETQGEGEDLPELPEPPKKRKVSVKLASAIIEVFERKKVGHYVSYKSIAERKGIPVESLKQAYCAWKAGKIDLGKFSQKPEDRAMDQREQHAKTLELANRHLGLLLVHWECAIYEGEDTMKVKGKGAHRRLIATKRLTQYDQLAYLTREVKKLIELRSLAEKGYNSALEDMMASLAKPEKHINPALPVPTEVVTHVISSSDEQRALQALEEAAKAREAETPAT